VNARITTDSAKARLDAIMPEWRWVLINKPDSWATSWIKSSGEARRNAYRMRNMAQEILEEETSAIIEMYRNGVISRQSALALLFDYMADRVKEGGHQPLLEVVE